MTGWLACDRQKRTSSLHYYMSQNTRHLMPFDRGYLSAACEGTHAGTRRYDEKLRGYDEFIAGVRKLFTQIHFLFERF